MLSRLDNIAADSSGNSKFAAYTYLGAGTISKVEHPGVTNGLTLNYDTSGGPTPTPDWSRCCGRGTVGATTATWCRAATGTCGTC